MSSLLTTFLFTSPRSAPPIALSTPPCPSHLPEARNGRVPLNPTHPRTTPSASGCCRSSSRAPQWPRPSPHPRSSPPPSPPATTTAAWPGPWRAAPPRRDWPCGASRATSRRGSRSPRSCPASSASCSRATSSAAPYDTLSSFSQNNVHPYYLPPLVSQKRSAGHCPSHLFMFYRCHLNPFDTRPLCTWVINLKYRGLHCLCHLPSHPKFAMAFSRRERIR